MHSLLIGCRLLFAMVICIGRGLMDRVKLVLIEFKYGPACIVKTVVASKG